MYSNDKDGYQRIVANPEDIILGYNPPSDKQAHYEIASSTVVYTTTNGDETNIRAKHLPLLLHELRLKGSQGWHFASIFQNHGKPMQGLAAFELSLQNAPTTALLDYWLLRLGGHIRTLESSKKNHEDVTYLTALYTNLANKLTNYETKMGELANNPSRHQNAQRQKLVADFQKEWQALVQPAEQKYKKTDINNILKNVAAACTGIGLLWLFFKNLYRLSQFKGPGLFQFEDAHSRKIEHLQKLYDDIAKATTADAAPLENFFSDDIHDAYRSSEEFSKIIGQLQNLHSTTVVDGTYTKQDKKALNLTINAFVGVLSNFQQELAAFASHPEEDDTLAEIQEDFMGHWRDAVEHHKLASHIGEESHYSDKCQEGFTRIIDIAQEFGKEIEKMKTARERKPYSPGSSSQSDSGSD